MHIEVIHTKLEVT